MSEFKAIETQEELNAIIGERLKHKEEKVRESFAGYKSPDEVAEISKGFEDEIAKLKSASEAWAAEKSGLEDQLKQERLSNLRMRVASELGVPAELASRITGTDEESIRADAKILAKYAPNTSSTPLASTETAKGDSTEEALRNMANQLNFDE